MFCSLVGYVSGPRSPGEELKNPSFLHITFTVIEFGFALVWLLHALPGSYMLEICHLFLIV